MYWHTRRGGRGWHSEPLWTETLKDFYFIFFLIFVFNKEKMAKIRNEEKE